MKIVTLAENQTAMKFKQEEDVADYLEKFAEVKTEHEKMFARLANMRVRQERFDQRLGD